jgi:hypothetical protein
VEGTEFTAAKTTGMNLLIDTEMEGIEKVGVKSFRDR